MSLQDYLRVLRKRWRLILVCLVLAVGGAVAAIVTTTPTYTAFAQLFVSTPNTAGSISTAYSGSLFTQSQVLSYADIISSPEVVAPVIRSLGLPYTIQGLARHISASVPLNTVLINVEVTDTNAARAAAIADSVSAEFITVVGHLEAPTTGGPSPVRVSVVENAAIPTAPTSPKKKLDLGLGILVGLAIGVSGAVLRESLDTTIKGVEDLVGASGAPTLGVIGFDPTAAKQPLAVAANPHGPRAEAYRQLRTNLQFVEVDQRPRSLVIASCVPAEGKSVTACNLGLAFAQAGLRVLLVDADLRKPKVAAYLGLEGGVGLTTVLTQRAALDQVVQPWGNGLLQVLASGEVPPNPSELLASRAMATLLQTLEQTYEMVLIDVPPLLPVTDAAVVAASAGGALLVVQHGLTRRDQVEQAVAALQPVNARLLGTVLNMAPTKGPGTYQYGYTYAYAPERSTGPVAAGPAAAGNARSGTAASPGGGSSLSRAAAEGVAQPTSNTRVIAPGSPAGGAEASTLDWMLANGDRGESSSTSGSRRANRASNQRSGWWRR